MVLIFTLKLSTPTFKIILEEQKKEEEKKRKEEADLRSYDRLMNAEQMTSNKDGGDDSDDFM